MASPAYELILEVQAFDLSLDQLHHRAASHPDRERLNEIDQRLTLHDAEVGTVETARHELERQRKRLEDEVATVEARRSEIDGRLYGGMVTASKELLALQDEAANLLAKQTGLEDDELELMEEIEDRSNDLSSRAEARASIEESRAEIQASLDADVTAIEAEAAQIAQQRAERSSPDPGTVAGWDDLLARYDDLRSEYDGVPVARLAGGRCDGCHIQLSAVAVDQMAKMPDDVVVTCEECGRLLVR